MLKHIKDIRSPIAVAQQKHAARKASSIMTTDTAVTSATHGHHKAPSTSRNANRPPKLEVQDLSTPTPMLSAMTPQPGWPEPGVMSPAVDNRDEVNSAPLSSLGSMTPLTSIPNGHDRIRGTVGGESGEHSINTTSHGREMPPASSGVSYAVAIYPYMAEQEDEFDVVVYVHASLCWLDIPG